MNCRIASTLLATGALALAMTACGSGDDKTDDANGPTSDTPAQVTGTSGQQGETPETPAQATGTSGKQGDFKPDKNAPDSAGDRTPNAPDKNITKKPGGKASPAKP